MKELSQKFECSGRTVYRDFESRGLWQPELQSVENHSQILMRTVNRYEQIYRETSAKLNALPDTSKHIFPTTYARFTKALTE